MELLTGIAIAVITGLAATALWEVGRKLWPRIWNPVRWELVELGVDADAYKFQLTRVSGPIAFALHVHDEKGTVVESPEVSWRRRSDLVDNYLFRGHTMEVLLTKGEPAGEPQELHWIERGRPGHAYPIIQKHEHSLQIRRREIDLAKPQRA